jgi:hypothetical protein
MSGQTRTRGGYRWVGAPYGDISNGRRMGTFLLVSDRPGPEVLTTSK